MVSKTVRMWIARDKLSYELYLFTEKPLLCKDGYWSPDVRINYIEDDHYLQLGDEMFPEVTFDNSPQEVEIKLVNNL
jgi:hypothetical protein